MKVACSLLSSTVMSMVFTHSHSPPSSRVSAPTNGYPDIDLPSPPKNLTPISSSVSHPSQNVGSVSSQPNHITDLESSENIENLSRVPTALIDSKCISDIMASRLAICLLGYVLFMKSQVPL